MQAIFLPQVFTPEGKRLSIKQRLGNGAFGVVYQVNEKGSCAIYALKDILCMNESAIANALREVNTLKQVRHENIIRIVEACQFQDTQNFQHVLILTEKCSGGNLNERLTRASDEESNLRWMSQTAGALAYLHSSGIVHRDLKPENVLLSDRLLENVKLADFGLAREYVALKRQGNNDGDSWVTMYTQYYMNSVVGTLYWLAPEVLAPKPHYTEKADVFSLGVICFAILERAYVQVKGKRFYGAFVEHGVKRVGLGQAMAQIDRNIKAKFSPWTQGAHHVRQRVLDALQYKAKNRPSAEEVQDEFRIGQECLRIIAAREAQQKAAWCSY